MSEWGQKDENKMGILISEINILDCPYAQENLMNLTGNQAGNKIRCSPAQNRNPDCRNTT